MKVTRRLPQFKSRKALMIVAASQTAKFFSVENGQILQIGELRIIGPKYSDREGAFGSFGENQVYAQGSVLERQKFKIQDDFMRRFKEKISAFKEGDKFDDVFLFLLEYFSADLVNALPLFLKKNIRRKFYGNFLKTHPFDLLEKICDERQEFMNAVKSAKIKPAAKKILEKTEGAEI